MWLISFGTQHFFSRFFKENLTLKQEMQRIQKEIIKKDKMITELLSDKKVSGESGSGSTIPSMSSSNGLKVFEESKIKRIETELKILKKDRDEFFTSRFDKVRPTRKQDIHFNHLLLLFYINPELLRKTRTW